MCRNCTTDIILLCGGEGYTAQDEGGFVFTKDTDPYKEWLVGIQLEAWSLEENHN